MLSKRDLKYFKSLQLKKYRQQERKFLVEGAKGVEETLASTYEVEVLLGVESYLNELPDALKDKAARVTEVKERDLVQVGTFKSNQSALAIVKMPEAKEPKVQKDENTLVLDGINDPGNLGTIIRIADWYGVKQIICSMDTADVYNPKVINSTMGSYTRVEVHYTNLITLLSDIQLPIYGTLLDGNSIYNSELKNGVILMGSESHGIRPELREYVTDSLKIPGKGQAESLNVGVATAVVLDNFARTL